MSSGNAHALAERSIINGSVTVFFRYLNGTGSRIRISADRMHGWYCEYVSTAEGLYVSYEDHGTYKHVFIGRHTS